LKFSAAVIGVKRDEKKAVKHPFAVGADRLSRRAPRRP